MTFEEMRTETELLYESINSSADPGFIDAEWGQILTAAQRKVVIDILKEGITRNSFNMLAIDKLIQSDSYSSFSTDTYFKNSDNSSSQTLNTGVKVFDSKFFWILDEYVTTASYSNIKISRISFDFYRANINNPFRKPNVENGFWLLQYNNVPIFITDGSTITGYNILAAHHPDNYPIGSGILYGAEGSCLNVSMHPKIVEKAVLLARMSITDPAGYQLALNEFKM